MGIKEEFEKLPEIKLRLIGMVFCFSKNQYIPKNKIMKEVVVASKEVNLAWYAFQEQQKKIDDVFLENAKLKHVIDQVKLHNGSLGFRSMQRMIEELLK